MPAKEMMGGDFLTTLSMESNHLSALLSMDSGSSPRDELERELHRAISLLQPPDINIPLSAEPSPPPPLWGDSSDILDVNLGHQHYEAEVIMSNVSKAGKKCAKRLDSVWGAWFFFTFYFKPALNEKSKSKVARESNGVGGYGKSDLKLDVFLVQHDMENMYMWVFKDRPDNALGKMPLRSYMNGHLRQGERPFPFSSDKGFVRSHRMQRKQYRGLSNPQCVHGIEIVRAPNLLALDEEERKKWIELTGRDLNFAIPLDASDFSSWRNLQPTEFELERPLTLQANLHPQAKRMLNGCDLNIQSVNHVNGEASDLLAICNKRGKHASRNRNDDDSNLSNDSQTERVLDVHAVEPPWLAEFTGVMRSSYGPVTASKTIYEDEEGFLIIVSMPFVDLERIKVTWRNTYTHGIVKISCVSTGPVPTIRRQDRIYELTDPASEHCPQGGFIREIPLPNRIPEDAKLEAYGDVTGTMLEILVPKHRVGPEEHEVFVCLRPSPLSEYPCVGLTEALV